MPQAPTSGAHGTAASEIQANAPLSRATSGRATRPPTRSSRTWRPSRRFDAFLEARACRATVAAIRREHVEAFIEDQLARLKPASAANRYRSLQQFFRWLVDEGEIKESPMARMKPPTIPETPPPVLPDDQIRKLLAATRRDWASMSGATPPSSWLLVDTGIRLAEIAGLTSRGHRLGPRDAYRPRQGPPAADRRLRPQGRQGPRPLRPRPRSALRVGLTVAVARAQGPTYQHGRIAADAPKPSAAERTLTTVNIIMNIVVMTNLFAPEP